MVLTWFHGGDVPLSTSNGAYILQLIHDFNNIKPIWLLKQGETG